MGKWHSQLVEIFNRDDSPYTETFKDKAIVVPARGSIKMPRQEAQEFIGTMSEPLSDGGWKVKMLEIRNIEKESNSLGSAEHVCNFCGFNAETKEKLKLHLEDHKDKQLDNTDVDEAIEKLKTEDGIQCPLCEMKFKNAAGLRTHMSKHVNAEIAA